MYTVLQGFSSPPGSFTIVSNPFFPCQFPRVKWFDSITNDQVTGHLWQFRAWWYLTLVFIFMPQMTATCIKWSKTIRIKLRSQLKIYFKMSGLLIKKYTLWKVYLIFLFFLLQRPNQVVAIKAITKKNLAKSQNLLGKEIKILKVNKFRKILNCKWGDIFYEGCCSFFAPS